MPNYLEHVLEESNSKGWFDLHQCLSTAMWQLKAQLPRLRIYSSMEMKHIFILVHFDISICCYEIFRKMILSNCLYKQLERIILREKKSAVEFVESINTAHATCCCPKGSGSTILYIHRQATVFRKHALR